MDILDQRSSLVKHWKCPSNSVLCVISFSISIEIILLVKEYYY